MAREFAKSFYKSSSWKQAREMALLRDHYLCQRCGNVAEEVHHITHLDPININDPRVSLAQDNLVCLCHECHTAMHNDSLAADGYAFDESGNLIQVITSPVKK